MKRLLEREVEGETTRKLKKYLLGRGEELWTWIVTGGLAQSNPAEQGIRFHVAGKRKVRVEAEVRREPAGPRCYRACTRRPGCGSRASERWGNES